MDPIVLVTRASKTPAFPDPAGAITPTENDANLNALKTAAEQLDAEKIGVADAPAIVDTKPTPVGADRLILLDSADSFTPKLVDVEDLPTGAMTSAQIRDSLETLTGANRLDASAIQNIPSAGAVVTVTHNGGGANPVTGDTLTASFSAGFSGSVQWQRNGSNIGGATNPTYVAVVADEGTTVRPQITSLIYTATGLPVGAPAATVPGAFTAGQWDAAATATAGEMQYQITALPSNGGSPITALEYRVNTGAAIALTGTGTGNRTVTAGWTAGTAADTQVRAVNAIGAGAWSDTKNRTPASASSASYIAHTLASGAGSVVGTLPAGVTASDTLLAIVYNTGGSGSIETMPAPSGWTAQTGVTENARGARAFTAPGNVGSLTFTATGAERLVLIGITAPLRNHAFAAWDFDTPGQIANQPTPSVTAVLNDVCVSVYIQVDDGAGGALASPGSPQAGYTRQLLDNTAAPRVSILSQASMPAGATGTISHDANANFATRFTFTGVFGS